MLIKRGSLLYKFLWQVDCYYYHLDGYIPDMERFLWFFEERPLFTKMGFIKCDPSPFPFRDRKLKQIANEYGGWAAITRPKFTPPEGLYEKFEAIGYSRDEFDHTRRFRAGPSDYMVQAQKSKHNK